MKEEWQYRDDKSEFQICNGPSKASLSKKKFKLSCTHKFFVHHDMEMFDLHTRMSQEVSTWLVNGL